MAQIQEADKKVFMSVKEEKLKKKLIKLLQDDGKGHHHAKYAERLKDFDINIVHNDPNFTAAISFDDGIIYISEGFLQNENLFYQLNVLMRHELLHNLLMHQIRMQKKFIKEFGVEGWEDISLSQSLHNLQNIVMDDEISNRRYTDEDKDIVRNMWLNGRVIGGLVTEDHRKDWVNLSVEEMYDKMGEEVKKMQDNIVNNWENPYDKYRLNIHDELMNTSKMYTNMTSNSQLKMPFNEFTQQKVFKQLPDKVKQVMIDVDNGFKNLDQQSIKNIMLKLAKTTPMEKADLINPETGEVVATLYTPEYKALIMEELKMLAGITDWKPPYEKWYNKVISVLSDNKYDTKDLQDILNGLDK